MKAVIYFAGDYSVGIFARSYEMGLPFDAFEDFDHREEVRAQIKSFYTELDSEEMPQVYFEDETN